MRLLAFLAAPCGYHRTRTVPFLKDVEKRASNAAVSTCATRNRPDIVQDSMLKLAQHYGDKPPEELPMLFQRILSNSTLDWFRRQKTQKPVFTNISDFEQRDGGWLRLAGKSCQRHCAKTVQSAEDSTNALRF
jgi:RNA polymerase sigma-70 factor (ECF subfamily)